MREQSKKHTIAVYARVGNASQIDTEQNQLVRQLQIMRLRELAQDFGWSVTGEFSDHCHGRGTERPCLDAMLEHIAHGRASAVLVTNEGRLGREPRVVKEIERKIQACGGRVFYADRLQNAIKRTAQHQMKVPVKTSGTKQRNYSVRPEH